jgi:hypothetical protein
LYYQLGIIKTRLGKIEEAKLVFTEGIRIAQEQGNKHTLSELKMALDDLEDS